MIIDAHTHVGRWQTTSSFEEILERLLQEMGKAGVDKSLVIAWIKNDGNNVSTEKLVEMIQVKERLYAIVSIDLENHEATDTDQLD